MRPLYAHLPTSPTASRRQRPRRAYSLLEVLITVLIIQIISSMIMVNVSSIQSSERLTRASEKIVVAARYARMCAMATGTAHGIEFAADTNTIRVYKVVNGVDGLGNPTTTYATVANTLISGGTYVIAMNDDSDLAGVRITGVSYTSSASSPYRITFGNLGGAMTVTNNLGANVTLQFGNQAKTIKFPLVGDATVQ